MKLKHLESLLEDVKAFDRPKFQLEQYPTSPHLAATMVFAIEQAYGDIVGKSVLDLGCGCGMLTIASSCIGASRNIGIDLDADALRICKENLASYDIQADLIHENVLTILRYLVERQTSRKRQVVTKEDHQNDEDDHHSSEKEQHHGHEETKEGKRRVLKMIVQDDKNGCEDDERDDAAEPTSRTTSARGADGTEGVMRKKADSDDGDDGYDIAKNGRGVEDQGESKSGDDDDDDDDDDDETTAAAVRMYANDVEGEQGAETGTDTMMDFLITNDEERRGITCVCV